MFRKKKIIHKKKSPSKFLSYFFGGFGMLLIFFLGLSCLAYVSDIDISGLKKIDKFYVIDKTSGSKPEKIIEKETKEKNRINILIVGRGGGEHDAPDLTDTIILASFDTKKNNISMLSIPRDLYVQYGDNQKGKINRLYEDSFEKTSSLVLAMEDLEEKVEEITNQEIDYFVNLDFKGFIDLIDSVGGVEVKLEKNFVDYQYPDGFGGYTTFILRKGSWTLDGETALKYARSRHSTSDFDRSLRQQVIINALKDKMISLDYLTSPAKIATLYETFQKDIQTDIPLRKIIPLAINLQDIKKDNILSSNMNDSCFFGMDKCIKGGFLYYPRKDLFGGVSVLLPEGASHLQLSEYDAIHGYTEMVFNNADILSDQVKINVFNGTKTAGLASELAYDLIRFGFNVPAIGGAGNTENKTGDKSRILYNRIPEDDPTLLELQRRTGLPAEERILPEIGSDPELKIEIILAEDYLEKTNGGIQEEDN